MTRTSDTGGDLDYRRAGRERMTMGLGIVLVLLILLDVAAWLWGADSRDGCDRNP